MWKHWTSHPFFPFVINTPEIRKRCKMRRHPVALLGRIQNDNHKFPRKSLRRKPSSESRSTMGSENINTLKSGDEWVVHHSWLAMVFTSLGPNKKGSQCHLISSSNPQTWINDFIWSMFQHFWGPQQSNLHGEFLRMYSSIKVWTNKFEAFSTLETHR